MWLTSVASHDLLQVVKHPRSMLSQAIMVFRHGSRTHKLRRRILSLLPEFLHTPPHHGRHRRRTHPELGHIIRIVYGSVWQAGLPRIARSTSRNGIATFTSDFLVIPFGSEDHVKTAFRDDSQCRWNPATIGS